MSDSFQPHGLYSPWNSPGQNTGVCCLSFLQGIFPTQGSNPSLPLCRQILYQLSHQGTPRILEWVAYPFSRGSSQPGSPALQADSLPFEPQGKPIVNYSSYKFGVDRYLCCIYASEHLSENHFLILLPISKENICK